MSDSALVYATQDVVRIMAAHPFVASCRWLVEQYPASAGYEIEVQCPIQGNPF